MEELIVKYFHLLFTSSKELGSMEFLSAIEGKALVQMNLKLSKAFTTEEIETAMKQMHLTKAPGPDAMPPIFFQKHWNPIGPLVTKVVLQALKS